MENNKFISMAIKADAEAMEESLNHFNNYIDSEDLEKELNKKSLFDKIVEFLFD